MNSHWAWDKVQPSQAPLEQLLAGLASTLFLSISPAGSGAWGASWQWIQQTSLSWNPEQVENEQADNREKKKKRKEMLANWKPCFSSQLYSRVIKLKLNEISVFETKI